MTVELLGSLAVLALVDSTSFGTLGIPIVLLARPQVKIRLVLHYLGVITAFYLALGVALVSGGVALRDQLPSVSAWFESTPAYVAQLVLGVALVAFSYWIDPAYVAKRNGGRPKPPGRYAALRDRLLGEGGGVRAMTGLALIAGVIEAASMVPYLGAIGLASSRGLPWGTAVLVLVAYCVVMVAPALVLLAGRLALGRQLEGPLGGFGSWMSARAGTAAAWVVGIVGALLAVNAASVLFGHSR